jgi:hypothetical protein
MLFILGMFSSSIKLTPLLPRFYRIGEIRKHENNKISLLAKKQPGCPFLLQVLRL